MFLHLSALCVCSVCCTYLCVCVCVRVCACACACVVCVVSASSSFHETQLSLQECDGECVFKVWHLETSRILYFKAPGQDNYTQWMEVATNGADYIIPDASTDSSQSLHRTPSFYYFPPSFEYPDEGVDEGIGQQSMYSSYESLASSVASCQPSQGTVHYKGLLKRKNDSGKWLDRHCCIKDNKLLLYYTHSDLTPLSALVLSKAKVEIVQDGAVPKGYHAFTIQPSEGPPKAMMFASSSEGEMWNCLVAMFEASQHTVKMSSQDSAKLHQIIKQQRQPSLVSEGQVCICACMYVSCTHTHTHTHARTHARTHTRTHARHHLLSNTV